MFEDIISDELRSIATDAIKETLRAFSVLSRFYYPSTTYIDCNCANSIENQSPNPYIHKTSAACSICNGTGKKPVETYEDINIPVIFDQKSFKNMGGNFVFSADGNCQTMSTYDTIIKIKGSSYVIFDVTNSGKKFQRMGEPEIQSFGDETRFILTSWQEI